jgi:branched-chain amino acid transport system permease protein
MRAYAVLAFAVLALPLLIHDPTLETQILTFGLLAIAFNILLGEVGFLSLGQATFYGIGGYVMGVSLMAAHVPLLPALLLATIAGAAVSTFVGLLVIQRRGVYGVMLMIAVNEMAYYIALQWQSVTGGDNGLRGLPAPTLFGRSLDDPTAYYYFVAAWMLLIFFCVLRLKASPFGAVINAIRENEERARAIGYRTGRFKIAVFAITGGICGLAGGLNAELFRFVALESIDLSMSTNIVVATLLGGLGSPYGALLGAAIYMLLSTTFSHIWSHWPLAFGALFCLIVLFFRTGVWGILISWRRRRVAHA